MGKAHGIEQGKKIRIFQGDFGRLFLWINLPKISKKWQCQEFCVNSTSC